MRCTTACPLYPNSDIDCVFRHVCFGPTPDIAPERSNAISSNGQSDSSILVEFADMMLSIKLKTQLSHEVKLGFQKVDMTFLIVH
jgi:hypothetical protein